MNEFPPPTDDELLLAFVEHCPSMATADYARRLRLDLRTADWVSINDLFINQWEKRLYGRKS